MELRELLDQHLPLPSSGRLRSLLLAAAAISLVFPLACCGGCFYVFQDKPAERLAGRPLPTPVPVNVKDLPFELIEVPETNERAELEMLAPSPTGQTAALTAQILDQGTTAQWTHMWPEGRLAVCRLAAARFHPNASEEFRFSRARNYFRTIEELVFEHRNEETPLKTAIAVREAFLSAKDHASKRFSPP